MAHYLASNHTSRCSCGCGIRRAYQTPLYECSCGWYAYSTLSNLLNDDPGGVLALVSASGHIIEHTFGWRSEYMKIEALITRPFQFAPGRLRRLAKQYDCEIVKRRWPQQIKPGDLPNVRQVDHNCVKISPSEITMFDDKPWKQARERQQVLTTDAETLMESIMEDLNNINKNP